MPHTVAAARVAAFHTTAVARRKTRTELTQKYGEKGPTEKIFDADCEACGGTVTPYTHHVLLRTPLPPERWPGKTELVPVVQDAKDVIGM